MAQLSPIDLLTLSAEEQNILRYLTRRPFQVPKKISAATGIALDMVESTLSELISNSKIVEQLHEGERTYSARFQFRSRKVRNMPTLIQDFYQRSLDELLADVPLLQSLPARALQQLYALGTKRKLIPEEVLFWQGEKLDLVYLVESGLLKLTEIRGRGRNRQGDYLRRTDWIGLEEILGDTHLKNTCTAVTDTTLIVWEKSAFYEFINENNTLLIKLNSYLSQKLNECELSKRTGQGKIWVIDSVKAHSGTTTIATSLAATAQKNLDANHSPQVLLWPHKHSLDAFDLSEIKIKKIRSAEVKTHPTGFDVLINLKKENYSVNVQLDMLMNILLKRYEYIICDVGPDEEDFLVGLRGSAHTLITLVTAEKDVDESLSRWQKFRKLSTPGQKKILALNKATEQGVQVDPRFHLIIPKDNNGVKGLLKSVNEQLDNDNYFLQAIEEVYRRLSLSHSIAIFVPSTLDVDMAVDNSEQVQTTLSFLGGIFGGATSSDAEGVWRSEDSGLVTEQVTVVRTFVSKKALNAQLDNILEFASELKKEMKQEAVAVSVDNQMILV